MMNNKIFKYLPSVDSYERVFGTQSYHHQNLIRMKSSNTDGNDIKQENQETSSVGQKVKRTSHPPNFQMDVMDFPPVAASRYELNKSFAKEISDLRKHLKSSRNWEYTQFGRLVGTTSDQRTIGDGTRFFVMNYNILSQQLLLSHSYLYNGCDPRALNHSYRKQLLFSELEDLQPDILCLQEVEETDFYNIFEPTLFLKGYKGVYKKRTGDKSDGCAIFYKTARFGFVDKLTVECFQPHIPLLDRDNIALFIKLTSHHYGTGRRQTFVVGTTHILFNPRRTDVKLAQIQLILTELDRFCFNGLDRQGSPTYIPVILTGDFNADPHSNLIAFVTDGVFQPPSPRDSASTHYNRQQSISEFIPAHAGISDQCQHYKLVLERIKHWRSHQRSNIQLSSTNMSQIQQSNFVNICCSDTNATYSSLEDYYSSSTSVRDYVPRSKIPHNEASTSKLNSRSVTFSDDLDLNELVSFDNPSASIVAKNGLPNVEKLNSQISTKDETSVHLVNELNEEEHRKILEEIQKQGTSCTFGSGELTHALRFSSVYAPKLDRVEGTENAVTTKQSCWTTVDYIFYSKIWNEKYRRQTEGKLRLIRRLGLLTRNQSKEIGPIPNLANSSDHYSLVAEFVLK